MFDYHQNNPCRFIHYKQGRIKVPATRAVVRGVFQDRGRYHAAISCVWDFPKLKLIKTYLQLSMAQDSLNNLSIFSIENVHLKKLGVEFAVKRVSDIKPRKRSCN